jgi:FHS family glucose/mannose:H+ symporter-like MFS transporter
MRERIQASSSIWLVTMSLTGAGCTFMGSLLPFVSAYWHLHDKQSGLLLSCLFLGSFSGTMLLSRNLRRTLRIGATSATIGLIIFAISAKSTSGFAVGVCSLVIVGFGLGQLMSSINLLVGTTPVPFRSRALANLGSAWCVGAVLSPVLTTVLVSRASPTSRLAFFAPVFLLPVIASVNRDLPRFEDVQESGYIASGRLKRLVPLWIAIFLVYGGIEASVSGWMSMFALRYQVSNTGYAQWLASVFWLGLIVGRLLVAGVVTQIEEKRLLSLSILASACSLCFLVIAGSAGGLLVGIGLSGVCLGPIFPMLLSSALEYRLGSHAMGLVLAACGLGAAVFPSLLGIVSTVSSLRTAMFLPPAALFLLLLMRQQSPQSEPQSSLRVG